MVTYDPGVRARAADVAALAPRAVITGLSQLDVVPAGARAYVTVGDDDARAFAGRLPGAASRATGLFIEQREALVLTGAGDAARRRREMIGARVKIVVVSLGADGAVAAIDGRVGHGRRASTSAPRSTPPAPATCSSPPGRGATRSASASTTRCAGRRSTPRCRSASRPARAARPTSTSSWRRAPAAASRPRRHARARRLTHAGGAARRASAAARQARAGGAARRRARRGAASGCGARREWRGARSGRA